MNIDEEFGNSLRLHSNGGTAEVHRGEDGMARARPQQVRMGATGMDLQPPIRREMRQAEGQTLEETASQIVPTAVGLAGGATAATLGTLQDIGGLIYGGAKAMGAEEGEKLQTFLDTATEISDNYGSGAVKGYIRQQAEEAGLDEAQLQVLDEAMMAGEFGGIGGLAKAAVTKGPQMLSKAGDVVEGAGDAAKARMAEGGATLTSGVDPDPLIAAAGDAVKAMRGGDDVSITMAPAEARAHKTPAELLIQGNGEKAITPVVQKFAKGKEQGVLNNIDTALADNPDAARSVAGWTKFAQETMGGDFLPHPPMVAIKYGQSPEAIAEKLNKLTPELKAGVDEGFQYVNEIRDIYQAGSADPAMTGDLFVWGILSRGAGPVQQEAAFIDIMEDAAPIIQKVADGTFTEADMADWVNNMKKSLPEGSPGKQVTMNVNAAGKLLFELSKKPEGSEQTVLQIIHNMIADPNVPAKEIRRKFMTLTESAGIDNKVVSFILLVAGRDDVLVMDRIQGRHLWDDGKFEGKNIYDGIGKNGEGLAGIFKGPRGLLVTEALEDALRPNIQKAYDMVGRSTDASLGRFHWESWVIEGEQVVSHSTLRAVKKRSPVGEGVTEGKTDEYASGFRYIRGEQGPVQRYPLSDGSFVYMTPERAKEFLAYIKKPGTGVVPKGFKVTERADIPWYERTEVNRAKLDEAARQYENATSEGKIVRRSEGVE